MSSASPTLLDGTTTLSLGINKADPMNVGAALGTLSRAGVTQIHVDVMDGVYCPEITVGPAFVAAIEDPFIKDVHLRVADPLLQVEKFVSAGADLITFQVEAARHPHRVLRVLGNAGVLRGIALAPGTPLAAAEPLLSELDYLLLVMVDPGWAGQEIVADYAERLVAARKLIGDRPIAIGIDGGVTSENVAAVAALKPDIIVSGSAIFSKSDLHGAARDFRAQVEATRR